MKKIFTAFNFALLFFGIQSCSSQIVKNDWIRDNLKAKVSSYTESSYKVIESLGNIEKGNRLYDYDLQVKYNENGNKTERNENYINGTILKIIYAYDYDLNENLIEIKEGNTDGSLIGKEVFVNDEKGNRIESKQYYTDGSLKSKETFKYDKDGNQIEINQYYGNGRVKGKATYKYDNKGNQIKSNYYSDGRTLHQFTFKYDEQGNIIESNPEYVIHEDLNRKISYKYIYDTHSNWVKRIEIIKGFPLSITERTYEYF